MTEEFIPTEKEPLPKITLDMREALRAPFPDEAYSQHPTKTFLTTLKAMYVTERLNDVFGIGRWTIIHKVVSTDNNYVLMSGRLSTLDYDCVIPQQYGGHATSGKNTEPADGYKSAITDLLSKSASYLEIGIDVFKGKISAKGGNQNSQQQVEKVTKITDVQKFLELWTGGRIYSGKFVFYNSQKFEATPEQVEVIKKSSKYKE
jgi:hypothetical protein